MLWTLKQIGIECPYLGGFLASIYLLYMKLRNHKKHALSSLVLRLLIYDKDLMKLFTILGTYGFLFLLPRYGQQYKINCCTVNMGFCQNDYIVLPQRSIFMIHPDMDTCIWGIGHFLQH